VLAVRISQSDPNRLFAPNQIARDHTLFAGGFQQTVWLKKRQARAKRSGGNDNAPERILNDAFRRGCEPNVPLAS
jgi:hypothetical protein